MKVSSHSVCRGLAPVSLQHISVWDESMAACWVVEGGSSSHPEGAAPLAAWLMLGQALWDVSPHLRDPSERLWQSCSRAVGHQSSSLETGDLTLNGTAEVPEHPCPHCCRVAALLPHPLFRLLHTELC